jgi:SAM-dependent methyltransferase
VYVRVVSFSELHLERDRAESFGSVAEQYERLRPAFPDALLDDLAALGGANGTLDVGTGTGKVARGLARRGLPVLGVELDPRMAEVARSHGVHVEIARFEEWDDAGRRFDLVTCGDAWHWIEPKRGAEKVARVLRPGGTLVRFWNVQMLDGPVMEALEAAYRQHAPEAYPYGRAPTAAEIEQGWGPGEDPLPLGDAFSLVDAKTYLSERRVTGEGWAEFVRTISDHQRLPPERLALLRAALRETIDRFGETIRVRLVTTTLFSRRS